MKTLYPYQLEAVEAVRKAWALKLNSLLWLPTGAGKTVIAIEILKLILIKNPEAKILVLLNKVDLLNQTLLEIRENIPGAKVTEVCGTNGTNDLSGSIVVASIQTISLKLKLPLFTHVWVDEVHGADFEKGAYARLFAEITHDRLRTLGTTATPWRPSGAIYGPGRFFIACDYHISLFDLISSGHLVPPVCKKPEHQFETASLRVVAGDYSEKDLGNLVQTAKASKQVEDALARLEGRNKVVWACINIEHAEKVRHQIGDSAAVIHSGQEPDVRRRNFESFTNGTARHLTFVSVVSEGFNYRPIDAVVFLRPTKSPVRYVQTSGRALRTFPGKRDALILDYGRVVESLGPLDDPIIPRKGKGKPKEDSVPPMKFCPRCYSYCASAVKECKDCGYIFPVIENLTKKAFEGDLLQGNKPRVLNAHRIVLRKHVAKSGNKCLCIDYGMVGLSEYFIFDNDWSRRRMESRLSSLGVRSFSDIDTTVNQLIRGSYEIEYRKEGKYFKVTKIRKLNPEGDFTRTQSPGSLFLG